MNKLQTLIERIVEAKVTALLEAKKKRTKEEETEAEKGTLGVTGPEEFASIIRDRNPKGSAVRKKAAKISADYAEVRKDQEEKARNRDAWYARHTNVGHNPKYPSKNPFDDD